jgi:trans-aconitate 2-methyltransferase
MTHELDGRKYENASAHQKEWGATLIAGLDLWGTERVLDLGCGEGTLTVRIAELLPKGQVVGVDVSRGMIEAARPKAKQNLRFLLMDINDLALSEEFDVVFSNATLHWVKKHRRLYENLHYPLHPGGRIRFNFGGAGNCAHFIKVMVGALRPSAGSMSPHGNIVTTRPRRRGRRGLGGGAWDVI